MNDSPTQTAQVNRRARRERRREKRVARINRVQDRLVRLRDEKKKTKRNLVMRVLRFIVLLPVVIGLGALAIGLRAPELLEWPLSLMAGEAKGTFKASADNERVAEALEETRADAAEIGLENHGLMIVEEGAGPEGGLSVASGAGEAGIGSGDDPA